MTKTINPNLNTNPSLNSSLSRGGKMEFGTLAFDSSYPLGGEALTFGSFNTKPTVVNIPPNSGYSFEYDRTNEKVKVFTPGKSLIVEEVVTVGTNVGHLKHKPFYILAVEASTGGTTGPCSVIPTGETVATTQCAVDFPTSGLTFYGTDAVTVAKVTYIPLHETGPFSSVNLVIDEAVTASASKVDLTYQAAAVQYVWDDTDSTLGGLEPVTEAPTATHYFVIDIDDASDDTNIDCHADDAGNTLKVTYIKYGTFDAYQQLGDGDLTLASEIYSFTTNHYNFLAIPGLGTALVGEATATNVELIWSGPSASVGAGVPVLNFKLNQWDTNESSAITTLSVPIIFLNELANHGAMLEVANAEDLSGLASIPYVAIGF